MPPVPTNPPPDERSATDTIAAILAVVAVYVYFLIFAEFALIENLRSVVQGDRLQILMGALGLAGILGSLAAARFFHPAAGRFQLTLGFAGCAMAAGLSLFAQTQTLAILAGAAVGVSLAWTTVILALCLNTTAPAKHLGLCCGIGTGFAYALCNQPVVFQADPRTQTLLAVFAALAGLIISFRLRSAPPEKSTSADYGTPLSLLWVSLFFALVWIDSAAFFIIQHSRELRVGTWHGTSILQGNALVHLAAAIAAGWLLDRGKAASAIGAAFVLLLGACTLLGLHEAFLPSRILYTAGVSIYSTALVLYPARGGRAWLAGLLYAASGWFGSAMGIGMAQSLRTIPMTFVIITTAIAIVAFVTRALLLRRRIDVGKVTLLLVILCLPGARDARADALSIALGREVYVGEGCIHCHSQYVRPGTADGQRWGPTTPLEKSLQQKPPLYGNRRQGPDLAQIASRRTSEWNRFHLIAPRTFAPGSRMPSYAHLFDDGNPRGDALVAYLATLGPENIGRRLEIAQAWTPLSGHSILPVAQQKKLYAELCAICHGGTGQGDGPLAPKLSLRPPDFTKDAWCHVSDNDPELELKLARIIKFGQPGTVMAGHEYLSDNEVVALVKFVERLRAR